MSEGEGGEKDCESSQPLAGRQVEEAGDQAGRVTGWQTGLFFFDCSKQ